MSAFARPTNRLTTASCAAGSSRHPAPWAGPRGRTIEAYCRARPRSARRVVHLPEDVFGNPLLAALGEGRILQHLGQRALDRLLYLRFDAGLRRVVKRPV